MFNAGGTGAPPPGAPTMFAGISNATAIAALLGSWTGSAAPGAPAPSQTSSTSTSFLPNTFHAGGLLSAAAAGHPTSLANNQHDLLAGVYMAQLLRLQACGLVGGQQAPHATTLPSTQPNWNFFPKYGVNDNTAATSAATTVSLSGHADS